MLFISFIIGIFTRYVLKSPVSWSYELSTVVFVSLVMLSACYVQRKDEHIEFNLFYVRKPPKTQCLMRIVSNLIIAFTSGMLVPASVKYVRSMSGLKSSIMHIPRGSIFICFIVSFFIMSLRSLWFVYLDIRSFAERDYRKKYPASGKEEVK